MPKIMSVGPTAAAGGSVTHTRKEGKLGNIYRYLFPFISPQMEYGSTKGG